METKTFLFGCGCGCAFKHSSDFFLIWILCVERLTSEIFIEKGEELFKISLTDCYYFRFLMMVSWVTQQVRLVIGGIHIGFDGFLIAGLSTKIPSFSSQKIDGFKRPTFPPKSHQNFSLKKSGNPSSRSINF